MAQHTGRLARLQAYADIKALNRPASLTPRQWSRVVQLLYIVARSYPNAYKGQKRMADEMGVSERSVRYYVQWAQSTGMLLVTRNAGTRSRGNPRRTNLYHIVSASTVEAGLASKEQGILTYPLGTTKGPTDLTTSGPSNRGGGAATPRVRMIPAMPDPDSNLAEVRGSLTASEAINAANSRGRITRRPRAKDPDPARRLCGYFIDQWEDVVLMAPGMAGVRGIESRGSMTGYIRRTFIAPAEGRSYSEDEVRAFIEEFMRAVVRRTVLVKPGQSAWMRFTGWWGRKPATTDPDAARRYFEQEQQKRLTGPPDPA